jgi:CheY-like chemotaxis protein
MRRDFERVNMKLLIVEDDLILAELTAELLHSMGAGAQRIEAITVAADLQTAMLCLPEHNAVLCDGTFLISPDSRFLVEEWDVVRHEALRLGIHFVLYTGSVRALAAARESNTLALAKPAPIEEIYAALTCPSLQLAGGG